MYSRNKQQGFSIIELLIVVAIIAILLLVAVPQYQNYTTRAQVSEAVSLSAGPKQALSVMAALDGAFSTTVTSIVAGSGKYVSSGTVTRTDDKNAQVTYIFGTNANADLQAATETFILTGTIKNGTVDWSCAAGSSSTTVVNAIPSSCN